MNSNPRIVFLDQNKWIELLRAEQHPNLYPLQYSVLKNLEADLNKRKIVLPLSSTNIYETYKIAAPDRRAKLALLQARLSNGLVFRGRYARLEAELFDFLGKEYGIARAFRSEWWFLSDVFFEAFMSAEDERINFKISPSVLQVIRRYPAKSLFDYLASAPDEERRLAVRNWSNGSELLRRRVESRRDRHRGESMSIRRRIYGALMLEDEFQLLARFAKKCGVDWKSVSQIKGAIARRLLNEMPIYHLERELVLRLEAQERAVTENDFRDVSAYIAAIAYADEVIGENTVVNVARQAGFGKKYNTKLETNILTLIR